MGEGFREGGGWSSNYARLKGVGHFIELKEIEKPSSGLDYDYWPPNGGDRLIDGRVIWLDCIYSGILVENSAIIFVSPWLLQVPRLPRT